MVLGGESLLQKTELDQALGDGAPLVAALDGVPQGCETSPELQ